MMENVDYIKKEDDDEFSVDSWETVSNEELDQVMEFSKSLLSPDIPRDISRDFHFADNESTKENKEVFISSTVSICYSPT